MGSIFWISDSFRKHIAQGVHDLVNDDYKLALVSSAVSCPETPWAAGASYEAGTVVVPTIRNGHRYICVVGGLSDVEPSWLTDTSALVGTQPQWREYGGDLCAHALWSNFSGAEGAPGSGYAAGGVALVSQAISQVYRDVRWTAGDVNWTALTKTFRFAVLYKDGTSSGGVVNGVVGYQLCDDAFVDKVISGVDYRIFWSDYGILTIGKS